MYNCKYVAARLPSTNTLSHTSSLKVYFWEMTFHPFHVTSTFWNIMFTPLIFAYTHYNVFQEKTNIFDLRTEINIIPIIEAVSCIFWPTLFTHSKHKTKMPNDISKIMNCDSIDGK